MTDNPFAPPGSGTPLAAGHPTAPGLAAEPSQAWNRYDQTNGLAVLALVTGLLPLFFIAIPAAIVAIVQVNRRRERGQGLAVAGLVLGSGWALVLALVLVGALLSHVGSRRWGDVAAAGSTTPGTCLDGSFAPADCGQPHLAVVTDVMALPTGPWPGSSQVTAQADPFCAGALGTFELSMPDGPDLDYRFFAPDRAEWDRGEHRIVCVALPAGPDGGLLPPTPAGP